MTNFTNYLLINKNGELKQIINTQDINFLKYYNDAVRRGWTIVKGEQNEGYYDLMVRMGLR